MVDPATLMGQIDGAARAMDADSRELAAAIRTLAEAEAAYERAFQRELIALRDRVVRSGERMPAEDMRKAMAHHAIDDDVYECWLKARAEVDALRACLRADETTISARQTLLNALRAEMNNPTPARGYQRA